MPQFVAAPCSSSHQAVLPGWNGQKVLSTIRKGNKPLRALFPSAVQVLQWGLAVPAGSELCQFPLQFPSVLATASAQEGLSPHQQPWRGAFCLSHFLLVWLSAGQVSCLCRCSGGMGQHADPPIQLVPH